MRAVTVPMAPRPIPLVNYSIAPGTEWKFLRCSLQLRSGRTVAFKRRSGCFSQSCHIPFAVNTYGIVRSRIFTSSQSDQLLTYK